MATNYLIAVGVTLALTVGWVIVQQVARAYALRHPEFGPPREEGGGCGKSCLCSGSKGCELKERTAEKRRKLQSTKGC